MKQQTPALLVIGLLAASLTTSLSAFYPVDGWWWNPQQSGRGFNIEMQDDEMFIAAFHYAPSGQPVWWVANGRYNHSNGRMTGEFIEFENGQCPGCAYQAPAIIPGSGSPVTIDFHSALHATLQWNGESIPIQRQYWRFALDQPDLFLFGEFHFTSGALGIYFGNRIYFNDTHVDADGIEWLTGRVRGGSSQRIAIARYMSDEGVFAILLDSSPSFYQFYMFDMTKDRLEGNSWTFDKGDDPSGSGLPFIGHRVASRSYVQSGVGPHAVSHATAEAHPAPVDLADEHRYGLQQQLATQAQQSGQLPVDGDHIHLHASLRYTLEGLRGLR